MNASLPHRVGQFTRRWFLRAIILLAIFGVGVYALIDEFSNGLIVTGMRSLAVGGASWGLYITFDIYFVGLSFAGIMVAALTRLFEIKVLKPLTRVAELLAVVSLIMAVPCIFADLGRPLNGLLFLPRLARAGSPFFGTFTLVAVGYLFASLVYFWLAGRADAAYCARIKSPLQWFHRLWAWGYQGTPEEWKRHHKVSFWLALFILPLLVTAHSSLGVVFGTQVGRPGWYNALQAPEFVVLAGVSGVGALIVIAAMLNTFMRGEGESPKELIPQEAFVWLANFLWVLTLAYLYFMTVDELTANYASAKMETVVAHEVVLGTYSPLFWIMLASLAVPFAILFLQFMFHRYKIGAIVFSGALVNVGAILKRFLIVVPSQTYGNYLPYMRGSYSPTWVEFSIIIGLFAMEVFLFIFFSRLFPIVPLEAKIEAPSAPEPAHARRKRISYFLATLLTGVTFAAVGFVLSARFGTKPYLDPIIPWSPVLFIVGVMMSLYSAAVYEVTHI